MNSPLQIGVTGGIGSGKSLICSIFSVLGVPIYNADQQAKTLMNEDDQLKQAIINTFGTSSYTSEGKLNRNYLADKVFNDEIQLQKLNALVHPAVGKDYADWVKQHPNFSYVIKEAALMFESASYKTMDYVINISASVSVRIERVLKRDPFRKKEEVEAIMQRQLPEEERRERADFVIDNEGSHMILPQVLELHGQFNILATA